MSKKTTAISKSLGKTILWRQEVWSDQELAIQKNAIFNFFQAWNKKFRHKMLAYTLTTCNTKVLIQFLRFSFFKKQAPKKWKWKPYRYKKKIPTIKYAKKLIFYNWIRSLFKAHLFITRLNVIALKSNLQNTKNNVIEILLWSNKLIKLTLFGRAKNIMNRFGGEENIKFCNRLKLVLNPKFWSPKEKVLDDIKNQGILLNKQARSVNIFIGQIRNRFFKTQNLCNWQSFCVLKNTNFLLTKINSFWVNFKKTVKKNWLCFFEKTWLEYRINIEIQQNKLASEFNNKNYLLIFNEIILMFYGMGVLEAFGQKKQSKKPSYFAASRVMQYFFHTALGNIISGLWSNYTTDRLVHSFIATNKIREVFLDTPCAAKRQHNQLYFPSAHKNTQTILSLHIKTVSIKRYLQKKLIVCMQTLYIKLCRHDKIFSVKNLIQGIVVAMQLRSAAFLAEILQRLLSSTGWDPKAWTIAIKTFKKICKTVKRNLSFPIKIRIRLTGKWRGSARTKTVKIKIGKSPVNNDKNVIVTSGRTFAVLKPGTMGIKLDLFWKILKN